MQGSVLSTEINTIGTALFSLIDYRFLNYENVYIVNIYQRFEGFFCVHLQNSSRLFLRVSDDEDRNLFPKLRYQKCTRHHIYKTLKIS